MTKRLQVVILALCATQMLQACNLPLALQAQNTGALQAPIRAALVQTETGQSLRVLKVQQLPAGLQAAENIRAILDNSNTTYAVERHADGSLSIPLPSGRRADSQGLIELLLSDGHSGTWLLRFDTGPLFQLADNAFAIQPSQNVVLGANLQLALRTQAEVELSRYTFNWFTATGSQGPWQPLSGLGATIDWEPGQAGNYFLRVDIRETASGSVSSVSSPTPVIFVQASDQIARSLPADGRVLAGDAVSLSANLPELAADAALIWSYAQSPVGPFQPIVSQGTEIVWEPPAAGAYYLRIQVPQAGRVETYTSSRPLVTAVAADELLSTVPANGEITRGQSIGLRADLPAAPAAARYTWAFASSPQGPFQSIAGEGASLDWQPEQTGEFYLRLRVQDPVSLIERTYLSSEVQVVVRDSDQVFVLTPQPASLIKGQSVSLALRELPAGRQLNWFYAFSGQGPFQPISGQGQAVRWTPPVAGSFYLRAQLSGAGLPNASLTSASALVSVSESAQVISASPSGSQSLGRPVQISAQVPDATAQSRYSWFVGPSPHGPWRTAQTLDAAPNARSIAWWPDQAGSFYVKADVSHANSQSVLSFVSPQALVLINSTQNFFQTDPASGSTSTQGAVGITAFFQPPAGEGFIYAWSAAPSPEGPFTALGGSLQPSFNWVRPGLAGRFFIRLDARSNQSGRSLAFTSSEPLITIGESQTSTNLRF